MLSGATLWRFWQSRLRAVKRRSVFSCLALLWFHGMVPYGFSCHSPALRDVADLAASFIQHDSSDLIFDNCAKSTQWSDFLPTPATPPCHLSWHSGKRKPPPSLPSERALSLHCAWLLSQSPICLPVCLRGPRSPAVYRYDRRLLSRRRHDC